MKHTIPTGACLLALLTFPVLFAGGCSESSPEGTGGNGGVAGAGGSGGGHPLEGTWEGHAILSRLGALTLSIDRSGEITEILVAGSASTELTGGEVDDGPGIYTMTWFHDSLGPIAFPFLTDAEQLHAAIVPMFGPIASIGALERGGSQTTIFFESDVIGSWSGYGYAYDQDALDFVSFSPVTADASSGTPINFSATMPSGTITGVLPDFANLAASWVGTAVNGATVVVVMSPDKQFVAVAVIPLTYSSLEDLTVFALNRDP